MIKLGASKWDVSAALALIRPPVIAPKMTEVEQKYDQLNRTEEHEKSLMSDFELRLIKDQELLVKRKKLEEEGKNLSQLDEEISVSAIQKELEWNQFKDAMQKEYKLGDLSTVQVDDPKSLRSKIDQKLVLLVKQQLGSNISPWILPQLKNNGETLRQTVERCLGETFSSDVNVTIEGNAPMGFHKHVYPSPIAKTTGANGNLVFIYAGYINELDRKLVFNNSFIKDYYWCGRDDLDSMIEKRYRKYRNIIRTFLFE